MNPTPHAPLATKIAELAEVGTASELAPTEARALLDNLCHDQPDFARFLERKGTRLPEAHQHALLHLLQAAQATECVPALQQWCHNSALSLHTRVRTVNVLQRIGVQTDTSYQKALLQAEKILGELRTADPAPLSDTGELQTPWYEMVLDLPMALALDLARDLPADQPHNALAVLRTVRPIADAQDRLTLVDRLASIPLTESAVVLHDLLADTTDKAAQKVIKKALHRLKVQGVPIDEAQPRSRVVGTVTHRLERCLASHIDAAGDRVIWMIRTKSFGGYNIAYVVINYGSGIRYALGLQASKRELPELIAKAQEYAPLIDIEPTYCQYQLAQAQQMNLDTGAPVPEEYFALRDIIGEPTTTFEKAIIYTALSTADLQEARAYEHHADDLLKVPEFAGWTLPESIIQKYGDQLRDLEESQIVVNEAIQQERINEVYAHAAQEVLGETSRRLMRLRLEEMAYYLLQTERRRETLWAVAAAQSLEEEDTPEHVRRNLFVSALLERSLEYAKKHPSSNIILPFSRPSSDTGESSSRLII